MSVCLVTQLCPTLCDSMDCSPPCSSVRGDSPGKNNGVSCHALLQGIFSTQGSNSGLPHCRLTLYRLSHQGNSWILEWVAYPFSRGSFQPRNLTGVRCKQILYQLSYQGSPYIEFLKFSDKKKNKAVKNGQRIWIDISPKMYKWPHEQMLSLISYQGNTNQNCSEIPLCTHLDVCNQILFVEINAGEDVEQLETHTGSRKVKWCSCLGKQFGTSSSIELLCDPEISSLGTHPREMKTYVHIKTCTWMFIATLCIVSQNRNNFKCNVLTKQAYLLQIRNHHKHL